jgi:hypothetical protein
MGLAVLIAKVKDNDKWEPTIMEEYLYLKPMEQYLLVFLEILMILIGSLLLLNLKILNMLKNSQNSENH